MPAKHTFSGLRTVAMLVAWSMVSDGWQLAPARADVPPPPHGAASVAVPWHRDIPAAKAAAVASGRQMIVVFTASWNEPSSRFEAALVRSVEAATLLGSCFEPIRINVSDDPWTTRRMGVSNVPAACIIDDQEQVLVRFDCPATAADFVTAVCKASREAAVASFAGIDPKTSAAPDAAASTATPAQKTDIVLPPVVTASAAPSAGMPAEQVGLEGYCPVSVVTQESWIPGDPEITGVHQGRTYRFAGDAERRAFVANPDWYAPALSGDDAVLAARQGLVVAGKRAYSAAYKARLYLFTSPETRNAFVSNPETYIRRTQVARGQTPGSRVVR